MAKTPEQQNLDNLLWKEKITVKKILSNFLFIFFILIPFISLIIFDLLYIYTVDLDPSSMFLADIWFFDILTHSIPYIVFISIFSIIFFSFFIIPKLNKFFIVLYVLFMLSLSWYLSYMYYWKHYSTILTNTKNNSIEFKIDWDNLEPFIYYQNIYLPKVKWDIWSIYNNIEKSRAKIIWVVENSYDFHNFLDNKWYIRIAWEKTTECAFYILKENIKEGMKWSIVKAWAKYKICLLKNWNEYYLLTHIHPPIWEMQFLQWKNGLEETKKVVDKLRRLDPKAKIMLLWDFNASIYNPNFKNIFWDYIKEENSMISWTSKSENNIVKYILPNLAIDHVLTNANMQKDIKVKTIKEEYRDSFSDHKALIIYTKK